MLTPNQLGMFHYLRLNRHNTAVRQTLKQVVTALKPLVNPTIIDNPSLLFPRSELRCGWCLRAHRTISEDSPWWPWPGHACQDCLHDLEAATAYQP